MVAKVLQGLLGTGGFDNLQVGLLKKSCREPSHLEIVLDDQGYTMRLNLLSHTAISSSRLRFSKPCADEQRPSRLYGYWEDLSRERNAGGRYDESKCLNANIASKGHGSAPGQGRRTSSTLLSRLNSRRNPHH